MATNEWECWSYYGASPSVDNLDDQHISFDGNVDLVAVDQRMCVALYIGCCFIKFRKGF